MLGVLLVTCGVAGFEASTGKGKPEPSTDLEVENVTSDVRDEGEAECIASPRIAVEVSDEVSQSQTCSASSSSSHDARLQGPVVSSSIFCVLATSICLGGFIVASLGGT